MKTSSTPRRGTVLIAVLVCMGFATSILLGAVQTSLRLRREVRQELQLEQTKWLMDLGIRKAIIALQGQPAYDGETLAITPPLAKYANASIEITVNRKDQPDNRVRLWVTAQLTGSGGDGTSSTQRSTEIVVSLSETSSENP